MFGVEKVKEQDVETLGAKADEVWHEYFPCVLSVKQIDYMVEKFQSEKALRKQIEEGYEYYFLKVNGVIGGYMGIKLHSDFLYLSKFYVLKDFRSKGYGRKAFEFLVGYAKAAGVKKIKLSVNKYNAPSIKVYEKFGFVRVDSVVRDIGNGYIMDDFDYEYNINDVE